MSSIQVSEGSRSGPIDLMTKTKPRSSSSSSRQHVNSASPSTQEKMETGNDKSPGQEEDTDTDLDEHMDLVAFELNVCERHSVGSQDDGACLFLAIDEAFPGVLTISDLDSQIDTLHGCESHNLTRSQCGIPGYTWHVKCVHMALIEKKATDPSFKFTWSKVRGKREPELRDFLLQRNQGKFIVIGIMNYRLIPKASKYGNWKHAVLIDTDTGMLHDPAGCSGSSRDNMTIVPTSENLPKTEGWEGWLTTIQSVYRFEVDQEEPITPSSKRARQLSTSSSSSSTKRPRNPRTTETPTRPSTRSSKNHKKSSRVTRSMV